MLNIILPNLVILYVKNKHFVVTASIPELKLVYFNPSLLFIQAVFYLCT